MKANTLAGQTQIEHQMFNLEISMSFFVYVLFIFLIYAKSCHYIIEVKWIYSSKKREIQDQNRVSRVRS